jgi:hypothetical protein
MLSELMYDWRFDANKIVLEPSPLRLMITLFFPYNHSTYITPSLTRRWVRLRVGFAFVKWTYRTRLVLARNFRDRSANQATHVIHQILTLQSLSYGQRYANAHLLEVSVVRSPFQNTHIRSL